MIVGNKLSVLSLRIIFICSVNVKMSNPQQTHFYTWCKGQVQIMLGISPDESTDIVNSWVKLSDKELDATLKVSLQKFSKYFFLVQ